MLRNTTCVTQESSNTDDLGSEGASGKRTHRGYESLQFNLVTKGGVRGGGLTVEEVYPADSASCGARGS